MMGGERLDISVRNAISTAAPKTTVTRIMLCGPIGCQTGFAEICLKNRNPLKTKVLAYFLEVKDSETQ
jgi:S-ribosylhomocysteine lyase LuxS involved in autoinducer biosynthesis